MVATVTKRVLIPVLLVGSMFSPAAGEYEERINIAVWVAATIAVFWALRSKDYFMAGGMCLVALIFSPLVLPYKIFALLGYASIVTVLALRLVWKLRTLTPAP